MYFVFFFVYFSIKHGFKMFFYSACAFFILKNILTWPKEPFVNLFFHYIANELRKSFCLRPNTVFVLFYFSTWLPR